MTLATVVALLRRYPVPSCPRTVAGQFSRRGRDGLRCDESGDDVAELDHIFDCRTKTLGPDYNGDPRPSRRGPIGRNRERCTVDFDRIWLVCAKNVTPRYFCKTHLQPIVQNSGAGPVSGLIEARVSAKRRIL